MLWPRICAERCFFDPSETDFSARQRYLQKLSTSRVATTKGPRASNMRWLSILDAIRYADEENTTKLFLLLYHAIQKQWITSYEDIWKAERYARHGGGDVHHVAGHPASEAEG